MEESMGTRIEFVWLRLRTSTTSM